MGRARALLFKRARYTSVGRSTDRMGWFFALSSRDPNLVGCVLHLLQAGRALRPGQEPHNYGMGYYQAALLGKAVREGVLDLESVLREQGGARQSPLSCAVTNGRALAVVRAGAPVSQRLIEGLLPCARCGLDEKTPELHPSLRPHRRLR